MTPDKSDVLYGTLGLMVIKTLEALGPLHGYRIARRIEQISGKISSHSTRALCIRRCSSWRR
jgi:DNA-binding PadR family transcriptional regulator